MSSIKALGRFVLGNREEIYYERKTGNHVVAGTRQGWREEGGGGRLAKRRKKISHSKRVSALRWRERKGGGGEVSFSLSLSLSPLMEQATFSNRRARLHFDFIFAQIARNFRRIGERAGVPSWAREHE